MKSFCVLKNKLTFDSNYSINFLSANFLGDFIWYVFSGNVDSRIGHNVNDPHVKNLPNECEVWLPFLEL